MNSFSLTTPVAFLVFNRPETTAQVFSAIREARPSQLLIVADGPRSDCPDDIQNCAEVLSIVDQIDWPCEVSRNVSAINLGCKLRVSSGLDWVFSQVEEAIILEDDCLPDPTFFRFCQELLDYYREDQQVGMISGDNFQFGHIYNLDSYYFSKYCHIWGWATWRDRWVENYDVNLSRWPEFRNDVRLRDVADTKDEYIQWAIKFEKVYRGKIDTWDFQWVFANWSRGRLSILPAVNLVSNLGFDPQATHTKKRSRLSNIERNAVSFPLQHPHSVIRDSVADTQSRHTTYSGYSISFVVGKIIRWFELVYLFGSR